MSRKLLVVTETQRTAAVPAEMRIGHHPNIESNCAVGLKEINPLGPDFFFLNFSTPVYKI